MPVFVRTLYVLSLLIMPWNLVAETQPRIQLATAFWNPYAYEVESGKYSGIAVEVAYEVFKRLGVSYHLELHPTNRLNLLIDQNQIDINFADSPLWNDPTDNQAFVYSDPYTNVDEHVYFRMDKAVPDVKPEHLHGKLVGISMGYYYEEYKPHFDTGKIKLYEAYMESDLINLLENGRLDAVFFDELLFEFLIHKYKKQREVFVRSTKLSSAPLSFKLNSRVAYLKDDINAVLKVMKKDGSLQKIINRKVKSL